MGSLFANDWLNYFAQNHLDWALDPSGLINKPSFNCAHVT
jgi:hypothetical protein